jgi:hypothetical protein
MLIDIMKLEGSCASLEIRDPEWVDIERVVRELNRGCVVLNKRGDRVAHVLVDAGEGEGGFVVQVCLPDGSFHYLLRPSKTKHEAQRVVGGQLIRWPENRVCTLSPTLKAIKTFATAGTLGRGLRWELGG